jgi:hypothetical protein
MAHDHDHRVVPSDPALRTKALESLLEKPSFTLIYQGTNMLPAGCYDSILLHEGSRR